MTALLAMLLAGCSNDGSYEVQGTVVVYSYWTFSFGQVNDTLPGADPATFQSVKHWLGHDNERVYFENRLVPVADIASLQPDRYPLFHDKDDYYYEATPLHVADVASFKTIKWFGDDFWAVDSRFAYYDSTRIDGADVTSFELLDFSVARDKNSVYFFGKVIPDADPATFEQIGNSAYFRDKAHIWCGKDLLVDADRATFVVDDIDRAHDKHGAFRFEMRDTAAVEE